MEEKIRPELKSAVDKASLAIEKKSYEYAIKILMQAVKSKPDYGHARQLLRLAEMKKYDSKPPNMIALAITRMVSFLSALVVSIYEASGEVKGAIDSYENILKNDPKNVSVMFRLGRLLQTAKMKSSSQVTLEVVIDLSPKHTGALRILGQIYQDFADYEKARFCFKKVLELVPGDHIAEKGFRNIDALTTIEKGYDNEDEQGLRLR